MLLASNEPFNEVQNDLYEVRASIRLGNLVAITFD